MPAHVELAEWVNEATVERAYKRCRMAQLSRQQSFADTGMRAARARDPRLLKALEGMSTVLRKMSERQLGASFNVAGLRVDATEYQMFANAYRMVDEGNMVGAGNYEWLLGGACVLAGIIL